MEQLDRHSSLGVPNGLKDARAIQGYFIRRVAKIVAKHGKTMIGWDEVFDPTLPPRNRNSVLARAGVASGSRARRVSRSPVVRILPGSFAAGQFILRRSIR